MNIKRKQLLLSLVLLAMTAAPVYAQRKPDSDQLLKQIKIEMDVRKDYAKALTLCKKGLDSYPGDMDFQFLASRLYLLNNDVENAQKHAEIVLRRSPEYKDAYLVAANAQLAKRNSMGALRYLDKGLQRFPRDRDMRVKKMAVYQSVNLYVDAERQADTILALFAKDPYAVTEYINYHVGAGQYYLKQGNSLMASRHFERVLELDPKNKEAQEGTMSLRSQSGDEGSTLIMVNKGLLSQPNNYELMMRKVGILQEMKKYPEAIAALQALLKVYPSDAKARQMDTDLKLEAARYYKSTDPYYQYQSVLDKSPGNREALDNVVNIAISRGLTQDALYWINRTLEHSPSDKEMLLRKMSLLQQQQKNIEAAAVAERLIRITPGDRALRAEYQDMQLVAARDFAAQQMPDSALWAYNKVLSADPRNEQALNSSVSILAGRKDFDGALQLVDKAISYYPNDLNLATKKAGILLDNEQYEDAMQYLEELNQRFPGNTRVSGSLLEAYMSMGRRMMGAGNYTEALAAFNKALELQPYNKEAINSSINIELASPDVNYEATLTKVNAALERYGNDKDLLLKKSEILMRLHRYEEAYSITESLQKKYPYNNNIRDAYSDQLLAAAADMRQKGDTTAAIALYNQALTAKTSDTLALLGLYNVYVADSNFEQSLATADRALVANPGNNTFLLKRAASLEFMDRFKEASLAADTVARRFPENKRYQDYVAYLKNRTFRNQLGVSFLNSKIDSSQSANIATIQYTRFIKRGTITARLNFAGRSIGTGLQGELESYYNHTKDKRWYSYIVLGAGNAVVFPKYKVNYSLFHSFSKSWEAEIGGRYLGFDTLNSISGVASLARYFGDFWLNLKGYATFVSEKQYFAANLTLRQYLQSRTDFFYTTFGYGNTPDDFSRAFQLDKLITFTTYSIGGGYQKVFNYRNTLSINGTWFNQRTDEHRYRNQYDIYVTFFRRF